MVYMTEIGLLKNGKHMQIAMEQKSMRILKRGKEFMKEKFLHLYLILKNMIKLNSEKENT